MPYSEDQVYSSDNFIFATQAEARLPTLYFRTHHGSGRLRQQHEDGPKIQDIRMHTSHAFFSREQDKDNFYGQLSGETTRARFRELRRQYDGTNIPKAGYYHVEASFNAHEGTGKALKIHRSGGTVVGAEAYEELKDDVATIYQNLKDQLGR